jgi:peptidoglycan/xylan/chitin deacetylase (PgdA/CDA1 family)
MTFRLDRFATLYVVNPVQRQTSRNTLSIPILMYHSITDEDEAGVQPYYRTTTSPETFAEQMRDLDAAGYSVLSLTEAASRLKATSRSPGKCVVITFDDGYGDFRTHALPVLARYGFTATVFLPTAYIGDTQKTFKSKLCLTWSEVRQLQEAGISFGSHTVNHPQLHELSPEKINQEVVTSKQTIEQELGREVESFAYPYAFPQTDAGFKKRLRDMLCLAGYKNGVCTTVGRPGPGSDLFFLKRLPINSCDDPLLFRAKLAGSYDWLAKPQYLVKMAKTWTRAAR